jgi:PEP-CTERM motif
MSMSRHLALVTIATPLLGMSPMLGASSAWAAACATASVATYEASGFTCNVGPVTFSDIVVLTTTSGSGAVALSDFSPFTVLVGGVPEYGLHLFYAAATGSTPDSFADVGWTYDVSGIPSLTDAFETYAGTKTGNGSTDLSETLSNGVALTLNAPGVATATFSPVGFLSAIKDQDDFSGTDGSATSSILGNAFSVGTVPEPSTWVMMFLGFAGLGYAGLRGSKKRLAIG